MIAQIDLAGSFTLPGTSMTVNRMGYGAMQLAGRDGNKLVWGPPREFDAAIAVLREAIANGVNHIDTADFYGPHVTNQPAEGSIEAPMTVLAELQQKGLVRHIGLSNVTPAQIAEARQIAPIVCVQNHYNLAHRTDDALIADLARDGVAYVPFFPLGGFTPLQSATLSDVAARLGATPMQVALAWLLQRSPNILVIPGTSSVDHLRENLQASKLQIPPQVIADLDAIGGNARNWRHTA